MDKRKRSLGRDVFSKASEGGESKAVRKMLQDNAARGPRGTKEVEVAVKLTPSNIRHLDNLVAELQKRNKGRFTRDELIRVAITLLSVGDF